MMRAVSVRVPRAAVRPVGAVRTYMQLSDWATLDVDNWNGKQPYKQKNLGA